MAPLGPGMMVIKPSKRLDWRGRRITHPSGRTAIWMEGDFDEGIAVRRYRIYSRSDFGGVVSNAI